MTRIVSFTKESRDLLNAFRDKIGNVRRVSDVESELNICARRLLEKVFGTNGPQIPERPLKLLSDGEGVPYVLEHSLKADRQFMEVWSSSDLPSIINRLAKSASHRHMHLSKHPEKTNQKIR